MSDGPTIPEGSDLAFTSRVREFEHLKNAADERLKTAQLAREAAGPISPVDTEYAKALAESKMLENHGDWLLALDSVLDDPQKEAVAVVQENMTRNRLAKESKDQSNSSEA